MAERKTHEEFVEELISKNSKYKNNQFVLLSEYTSYNQKILCKCTKDGYTWYAKPGQLLRGSGCHVCCNHTIIKGINDLGTTHPFVASLLKDKSISEKYSYGSKFSTDWVCPVCKNVIYNKSISQIAKHGLSCPMCSDGVSYPEKIMFYILKHNNIRFMYQFQPEWISPKRYDFFIPNEQIIVELDGGIGHGKKSYKSKEMVEVDIDTDKYKEEKAKENNLKLIRVDCDCANENNYLDIVIDRIYKVLKNNSIKVTIEKDVIIRSVSKSFIKMACDLWNSGIHDTSSISQRIGLSRSTIIRYLKTGSNIGLCDYSKHISIREKNLKVYKQVICLNTMQIFDNAFCASKHYGVKSYLITKCCDKSVAYCGLDENGLPLLWDYYESTRAYDPITEYADFIQKANKTNGFCNFYYCISNNKLYFSGKGVVDDFGLTKFASQYSDGKRLFKTSYGDITFKDISDINIKQILSDKLHINNTEKSA